MLSIPRGFYKKGKHCHQYVKHADEICANEIARLISTNFFRGNGHVRTIFAEFAKFNEFLRNFVFYQLEKGILVSTLPGTYFAAGWRASNLGTSQLKSWK